MTSLVTRFSDSMTPQSQLTISIIQLSTRISNAFLPRFMYFKKDAKNVKRRQPYVTFTLNALDV